MDLVNEWLRSINVRRSERHGGTDFTGNDCHTIISSTQKLRTLPRFPQRISQRYEKDELVRRTSITLVTAAIKSFSIAVKRTMSLNLHPEWAASILEFKSDYANFVDSFNKFKKPQPGRSPTRISPKLQCFFYEVPVWINIFKCSLNFITEQAFETLHKVYLLFEARYKIPRCGAQILPAVRKKKTAPGRPPWFRVQERVFDYEGKYRKAFH